MHGQLLERVEQLGLIPIITIESPEDAVPLVEAILAGGLPCAEVTFRTAAARESIGNIHSAFPDILLGAGTVLTTDQVQDAVSAGAEFIVTPGFNPRVVDFCLERSVPIFPGVCTPSEVEQALQKGLKIVKFFPAEAIGGLRYLKAIAAPFTEVRFIPTGGINADNLADYLAFPKVVACGGSWVVTKQLIAEKRFQEVTQRVRAAVEIINRRP